MELKTNEVVVIFPCKSPSLPPRPRPWSRLEPGKTGCVERMEQPVAVRADAPDRWRAPEGAGYRGAAAARDDGQHPERSGSGPVAGHHGALTCPRRRRQ